MGRTVLHVLDKKRLRYLRGKTIKNAKIERISDKYVDEDSPVEYTEFYDRLTLEFTDGSKLVIKTHASTEESSGIEISYSRKGKTIVSQPAWALWASQ